MSNKTETDIKNNKSDNSSQNTHKHHRQRMREKLQKTPEALTDHEIVEMLLYNVILQSNTNEMAHNLLNNAGSLRAILELDEARIKAIDGLGQSAASYIRLLKEFYTRCEKEKLSSSASKKLTRKNISERLHKIFYGLEEERLIMLTTDKNCHLINEHIISSGSQSNTSINFKALIKSAIDDKAFYVFLAHNHPNGILAPSKEDIQVTKSICEALSYLNISVVEHFIVTSTSTLGIINNTTYN